MIPVPREHDFGVDFYCLPRVDIDSRSEAVVELCGIQVKGRGTTGITFGGADKKSGAWKQHEIEWLRQLRVPLYLATVDEHFRRLEVYSVTRALAIFWKTTAPFEIACSIQPATAGKPVTTPEPTPVAAPMNGKDGDGQIWNVDLGAPLISLTFEELSGVDVRVDRSRVLVHWISADRWSRAKLLDGIPRFKVIQDYQTNIMPTVEEHWMYWNAVADSRVSRIAEQTVPAIVAMARHLRAQGKDTEARQWIGPLKWCIDQGWLEGFGRDVVKELDVPPPHGLTVRSS